MKKRSPEDRERLRRLLDESEAARRQMQEIIDRVDARMQEREARRRHGLLRRLFAR